MTTEDSAKSRWWHNPGAQRAMRAAAAAIPVVMVNGTAFIGQFGFLHTHVPWIVPGQVLVALTLESVAVYIAWHAHVAQMANDSATRLKLGAYLFALVIGAMNYSHYMAPHWRPTVMAVGMFLMSALSPWLWGIHSRRASRDTLMAKGLVEEHAVRLGANRWTWHPLRSSRVMYWATWHGINEPKRAIAHFTDRYGTADTPENSRKSVPSGLAQAVPATAPVPAIAPSTVPVPVPAVPAAAAQAPDPARTAEIIPGTELNGVPVPVKNATVLLEADATLSGGRPSEETVKKAREKLAETPYEDLPSIRKVAENLLGDRNQRRLAKRLLEQREAAEMAKIQVDADGRTGITQSEPAPRRVSGLIAPPVGWGPGGAPVSG